MICNCFLDALSDVGDVPLGIFIILSMSSGLIHLQVVYGTIFVIPEVFLHCFGSQIRVLETLKETYLLPCCKQIKIVSLGFNLNLLSSCMRLGTSLKDRSFNDALSKFFMNFWNVSSLSGDPSLILLIRFNCLSVG
ncbi:MAG: hypothetical protein ACYCUZ_05310 [Cuniculiplasma sp.]